MASDTTQQAASLRIQVVLFNNPVGAVVRLVDSLVAAVSVARQEGSLRYAELAIGDCSPEPNLDEETVATLLANTVEFGLDDATYEHFGENLGSAGGSNRLAQAAETDRILVLNPDTYASPWMLHRQLQAFRTGAGVVEARQLPVEHPKKYHPVTHEVSWGSGACTMFRRDVFEVVGGYDTDHFFLHCDDVDLSWRIRAAGYDVVIEPSATVIHDKSILLTGTLHAPEAERYYGLLGKLMLATRFGRPDIVKKTIAWVKKKGDSVQKDAVAEFERRSEAGSIPDEIPDAETYSEFVGTGFAKHRF